MAVNPDLALIFEPEPSSAVQILCEVPQRLHALMATDHPLAVRSEVRLSDCMQFPLALPSQRAGIRHVLDMVAARRSLTLSVTVESDSDAFLLECLHTEPMIAFQIPVAFSGRGPGKDICALPVHMNDISLGSLQLAQQRGRTLPVAVARFASSISDGLSRPVGH